MMRRREQWSFLSKLIRCRAIPIHSSTTRRRFILLPFPQINSSSSSTLFPAPLFPNFPQFHANCLCSQSSGEQFSSCWNCNARSQQSLFLLCDSCGAIQPLDHSIDYFRLFRLPVEVIKSNKEYTEDDVTDLVGKGSSSQFSKFDESPFNFPGLKSDVEGIERHFLGGINRFFEAAEQMHNSLFDTLDELYKDSPSSSWPSMRQGVPIEDYPQKESSTNSSKPDDSGNLDLSGLARDV